MQTPVVPPETWLEHSPSGISVMTFNTLRRNYNFTAKYWVPEEVREWDQRQLLHEKLFSTINADIICVQEAEVDVIENDFAFVTNIGYKLLAGKDTGDTHVHTKPSIIYKHEKLELKWHIQRTRTIISLFEDKSGHLFYVINCHLQGGKAQDQKCFQVRSALQQLQNHAKTMKIPDNQVACFICGDFNANQDGLVHQLLLNGQLNDTQVADHFKSGFKFNHHYRFQDAHALVLNRPYTFKWGVKDDAIFETLDYIYYTPNVVDVIAVRNPLTEEQQGIMADQCGIPNTWNPSDHLPVVALFKFK